MVFMKDVRNENSNINGLNETMETFERPVLSFETRRSKKTGNDFDCLVLRYKGYEKLIFLERAERYVFEDLKGRTF